MKKNMSTLDKGLRIFAALVVIGLYYANVISSVWAIVLLAVAAIFIATSFMGFAHFIGLLG